MKITFFLSLLCLPLALAQDPPPEQEGRNQPAPIQILGAFFEFDDTQVTEVEAIFQAREAAMQPVLDEIRATTQALRELLGSEDPDATAVGELVLAEKALKEQTHAVQLDFLDSLTAIFTEEQSLKYAALVRAERLAPVVKAAKAIRLPLVPPTE